MALGIKRTFFSDTPKRPAVDEAERVYAVGDIHGRHDLMMTLLDKIADDIEAKQDARQGQLVFLGDYIDRGDHPRKVLEALRSLLESSGDSIKVLRGNHEEALLQFVRAPIRNRAWLDFGAEQTIADYGVPLPPRAPSHDDIIKLRDTMVAAMGDDLDFLSGLSCYATSGDVIFSHAGIAPGDELELQNEEVMLWGHAVSDSDRPAPGKLVVHGHYDAIKPVERPGRICVDTGAYYSGCLTAVRLDTDTQFLSVRQ